MLINQAELDMQQAAAPKVSFVSLGCPKALVDSERIITRLRAEGYELARKHDGADIVIVNTCGFLDSAKQELLGAIGEAMAENGKVIVTGCMGAEPEQIEAAYPGVLSITGPQQYESVLEAVHRALPPVHNPHLDLVPPQGVKLTPRHYAYLKISEGCNNRCSFCIIPKLRGDLVSRPANDVLREAERLVTAGVKELLVISQDTSAYGVDIKYADSPWKDRQVRAKFFDLAKELGELGAWVRLQYVYPYPHVDEVIGLMTEGKILPYLDIPFQHASPEVLKAMKRPAAQEKTLARIKKWREECPDLTLRSTFIVGFPGETDSDFRLFARLARRGRDRSSRLLQIRAGRGCRFQRHRQRRARRDQAGALERADGAAAENLRPPPEAQGRHQAADHHRRSRADGRKGSFKGRRAADRRRGLSLQPPPAEGRRDRHREDRTRGSVRPARQRRGVLNQTTPLDMAHHSAVWPFAMKLNRTNRRACLRRRSSDDGLRRVRRQR